jgi:DNA sulfur modification protein DndB
MINVEQSPEELLIDRDSVRRYVSIRRNEFLFASVSAKQKDELLGQGWELDRQLSNKFKLKKAKSNEQLYKDFVWITFANLGFDFLNRQNSFSFELGDGLSQDLDVIAADKETILLVQCLNAESPTQADLKKFILDLALKKERLIKASRKLFGAFKLKVKFILATKNYWLSEADSAALEKLNAIHFDEEAIQYYSDLTRHLGLSARFQLLGNLFNGQKIPELDNKVAAIQGKMGGLTYYSFSIEPEKLLKIGYVLHRNKANKKLMPTYQRVIKKSRLKAVQQFVDNGGYFPNSIVINVVSEKLLKFERANLQVQDSISRLGILHLPQEYRSAFIIDGQHRLYGYANSEYKTTNSIPVVAFVNLDRSKQVELFMQINENQKAVPKNLRNTLNSDLLWNSENLIEQTKALKLQIAQDLGEDIDSPLYEKVIIGENIKTSSRCVTIDTVKTSLDRCNFFGTVSKDSVKHPGTFYSGNLDAAYKRLLPFLKKTLTYVQQNIVDEWAKGEGEENDGFLTINPGIYSLIIIISDIVDHLEKTEIINPRRDSVEFISKECEKYLKPVVNFFKYVSDDEKKELKRSYGIAGRTKYWRRLQRIIRQEIPEFNPPGLDEVIKNDEKQFSSKAYTLVHDLEKYLNDDFRAKLEDHYGPSWFKKGVPETVYDDASALAAKKNRQIDNPEDEKEPWDCLHIIDYRKIAVANKNWTEIFEKRYTKPGEEKIAGGKDEKTKWMVRLEAIRNKIAHNENISEDEFIYLTELYEWLIKNTIQNKLLSV